MRFLLIHEQDTRATGAYARVVPPLVYNSLNSFITITVINVQITENTRLAHSGFVRLYQLISIGNFPELILLLSLVSCLITAICLEHLHC